MKRKYLHCIVALQVILLISLSACSKQKATERVLSKQRIAEHSYNLDYYGELYSRKIQNIIGNAISAISIIYPKTYSQMCNENIPISIEFYTRNTLRSVLPEYSYSTNDTLLYIINISNNNGFVIFSKNMDLMAINNNTNIHISDCITNVNTGLFIENPPKWILTNQINILSHAMDGYSLEYNLNSDIAITYSDTTSKQPSYTMDLGQNEPYNELCFTLDNERAVAGCVPTALTSWFADNEWPNIYPKYSFTWNDIKMDWQQNHYITSLYHSNTNNYLYALCKEISGIGHMIGTEYGTHQSETNESNIIPFILNYYNSAQWTLPTQVNYINILNDNNSILVKGQSNINNEKHLWLIDGIMYCTQNKQITFLNTTVCDSTRLEFVHFDYCWDGYYNTWISSDFLQIYENEITHQTHANTEFCIDLKLLNIGNRRIQL